MLEQATLDVLARAAEIGLPEAAGVPASVYDPFLRPFIRKKVQRAIAVASAATQSARGDHVLRLAFLRAHPAAPPGLDPDDARAVAEAFEKLAKPFLPAKRATKNGAEQGSAYRVSAPERDASPLDAPPRPKRKAWPITFSLLGFVIVSLIAVTTFLVAPYALPSPLQKFASSPFGKAAGVPLTEAVVASGTNGTATKRQQARAQMMTKDVEKQIGTAAYADLERLLDTLPDAVRSRDESTDDALRPLLVHVNSLNGDLARAHVPALLHTYANGYVGRRSVWVTSFFVEDRSEVDVGGHALRFARGRRLDELNLADSTIYKGALEDWAVLSLDLVDEEMVQQVLRPLAMETPMGPEEWSPSDKSADAELARVAGRQIVAELRTLARIDRDDAITLHSAISRRNDAMVSLNKMGIDVEATSRIRLSPSLVRNLERMEASAFERKLRDEVLHIDSRMKLYAKPLEPIVAELARLHEETFVGRFFEEPRVTAEAPPATDDEEGDEPAPAPAPKIPGSKRARSIAASKLALLARPQSSPRLALWLTYRTANDRNVSSDERHALWVVLEAILFELDASLAADPLAGQRLTEAMRDAFEKSPEAVRAAAGKAYEKLLGRPVPALTRKAL